MKQKLRKANFAAIRALSVQERLDASQSIRDQLAALPEFIGANTVFSYLPLPSEPDLTPLIDEARSWCFSRVLGENAMEFRVMEKLSLAVEGDHKIREPDPERCPLVAPGDAEIILVPGVGFDPENGNRLGRGKGHYDRYLARVREQSPRVTLVGVCFDCQLGEIPSEPHDQPMDIVVSG